MENDNSFRWVAEERQRAVFLNPETLLEKRFLKNKEKYIGNKFFKRLT